MRLTLTTDKLQVVLAGAITTNHLHTVTLYRDVYGGAEQRLRNVADTNNTTDVDLCPAPAAGHVHEVDWFSVYNNDTVAATVTVKFDANATEYIICKQTLQTGQTLEWNR